MTSSYFLTHHILLLMYFCSSHSSMYINLRITIISLTSQYQNVILKNGMICQL